ncbi:uncharacterized protein RHOBADRAFT_43074 [Rhodotorula graminis WP1]|uniref:BHLH domain-containing protein n=1 Tax=Rhodotorula graminis (strain WP1) TaxID=578459 RepID=A0A194S8B5_RHOGW|nr:uncharacterized protein RHOBADRAFT_43074 [Rhodotorula graminis WP1]KPV75651.1 hypothetical protein RHOBADRAFT_43074 [Rhodotorula graminis WP1]
MSVDEKHAHATWQPPTPQSTFRPLAPTSTLPVDHLVLLPPPFLSPDEPNAPCSPSYVIGQRPSPPASHASHDPDHTTSPSDEHDDARDRDWVPPTTSSSKRPRRSAAIAAARNIPRQPSPFDLEGGEPDEQDDDDDDADAASPSASPPLSSARAGSNASRRKVSHSLIERRRREKINECLAQLRETVPSLREEGERKVARAKERGRKRGRGGGAGGEGAGLHKLEILQGTILYIDRLRSRVDELEAAGQQVPRAEQPRSRESGAGPTSSSKSSAPPVAVKLEPDAPPTPPLVQTPRLSSAGTVDDHEASLLLLELSTSPELRPVVV